MANVPVIVVHGGAWDVPDEFVQNTLEGVKTAALKGYELLKQGKTALDAVETAINYFEDNETFNAGRGSCLNLDGKVAMDASVQRGTDLHAGCVALLEDVRYPVSLARRVLEQTPHSFLGGEGAKRFALQQGVEIMPPSYFLTAFAQKEFEHPSKQKVRDTVGAVVVDAEGHVAAGTSTGGTPGKYVGRIGDVPLIGCGTYADDAIGAVSSTGHGETIMQHCLAHTIIKYMEGGMSAQESVRKSVQGMSDRSGNTGGAIAVSRQGEVGFHFTTNRMSWAYIKNGEIYYGIDQISSHSELL